MTYKKIHNQDSDINVFKQNKILDFSGAEKTLFLEEVGVFFCCVSQWCSPRKKSGGYVHSLDSLTSKRLTSF